MIFCQILYFHSIIDSCDITNKFKRDYTIYWYFIFKLFITWTRNYEFLFWFLVD